MMIRLPASVGEWIATIAGLFIVPAIGSAFWDFLAKPLAIKTADRLRTAVTRILTLGLNRAESSLFADIGKRNYLNPAVAAWFAASMIIAGEMGRRLGHAVPANPDAAAFLQSSDGALLYFVIVGSALAVAFYKYMRTSLVVSYIRLFDHSMAVYDPFLSETQRLILHSKFAMMNGLNDYRAVVDMIFDMSEKTRKKLRLDDTPENPEAN